MYKIWNKRPLTQMCKYQCKEPKIKKKKSSEHDTNKGNKTLKLTLKKMEICKLSDKDFPKEKLREIITTRSAL